MGCRVVSVGEVASSISDSFDFKKNATVALVNTGDVDTGDVLNHQKLLHDEVKGQFKKSFQKDDILYSEIRPKNGHYAFIDFDASDYVASTKLMVIRADCAVIRPRFLYAFLTSAKTVAQLQAAAESRSGTFPQITFDEVARLGIDLPPLEEQDRILSVHSAIEAKIALNAKLNGYLEELAKARLTTSVYEKKPFGMVAVGAFASSMTNGSTPSRKNPAYWDKGSIPWVKTGEVNNNLLFSTSEHITELALAKTSVHLMPKDTVIMALYGSGTAGRLAILQEAATTNQACTAMVCKSPSQAFYLFLTLQGMYREIDSKTRGSVQQNLSKDIVASLEIPAVTEDLLAGIKLADIYDQIRINERESLHLAALRDALLPKLMSGEIDVSEVDLTQLNSHLA